MMTVSHPHALAGAAGTTPHGAPLALVGAAGTTPHSHPHALAGAAGTTPHGHPFALVPTPSRPTHIYYINGPHPVLTAMNLSGCTPHIRPIAPTPSMANCATLQRLPLSQRLLPDPTVKFDFREINLTVHIDFVYGSACQRRLGSRCSRPDRLLMRLRMLGLACV